VTFRVQRSIFFGEVVGTSLSTDNQSSRAFIWSRRSGMLGLDQLKANRIKLGSYAGNQINQRARADCMTWFRSTARAMHSFVVESQEAMNRVVRSSSPSAFQVIRMRVALPRRVPSSACAIWNTATMPEGSQIMAPLHDVSCWLPQRASTGSPSIACTSSSLVNADVCLRATNM
jgi:hypothetical protein